MKLRIVRVDLPLKHVFSTSRQSVSVVRTIIVELEQDGMRGYGEAYESPHFGMTVEEMVESIEEVRQPIERYALADPVAFWRFLDPTLCKNRFAQSALDVAANDLWGKMRDKPLWKIWGYNLKQVPVSSFNIGHETLEFMLERFEGYDDWPIYKIRMGLRDDIEIIRGMRKRTSAPFWIDVGGGWDVKTALRYIDLFQDVNVQLLEQPLAPSDWRGMEILKEKCPIPIIADEACRTIEDLEHVADLYDGVHLKLVTCGGLTPGRWMLDKAKSLGLKTMTGSMVESTVGISALAQLAPQMDYLNFSGPHLIEKKVAAGVRIDKGRLSYPTEGGTGVRVYFR